MSKYADAINLAVGNDLKLGTKWVGTRTAVGSIYRECGDFAIENVIDPVNGQNFRLSVNKDRYYEFYYRRLKDAKAAAAAMAQISERNYNRKITKRVR